MKLAEKFTPEQLKALEDLEEVFGPTVAKAGDVYEYYIDKYSAWSENAIKTALEYFATAKMAESIDFAEIKRLEQEEYARKLAERSSEVRVNIMMGIFTSLIGKLSKSGTVEFETVDNYIRLTCRFNDGDFLFVEYNKNNYLLTTKTEVGLYEDDATLVKGSMSFRDQLTGVEAIYTYLEGRANG